MPPKKLRKSQQGKEQKCSSNTPPTCETEINQLESMNEALEFHDSSDEASEASRQKNKKIKVTTDLTVTEENTVIEWLEMNPIIYNKKLSTYKDTAKKEHMRKTLAENMGRDVSILKTWYSSLRTRYGRLNKKQSGQELMDMTERDTWIVEKFSFLRPHIHEVKKRPLVSVSSILLCTLY